VPTEEAGASQTRRKVRWVGARKASKPGQKKGRPLFKPGDREWQPLGMESTVAKRAITKREAARVEAEWLAKHFQLEGTSLGDESSSVMSTQKREAYKARLTSFPRIPDHDLQELQRIVATYGLPIATLDSDTAAFILRRVMLEYFKLNVLKRSTRPGLFTTDELLELMHRQGWTISDLAEITKAEAPHAGLTNISRWLNGASVPTGIHAMRVNRLIEQYVRKPDRPRGRGSSGGNPGQRLRNPTTNPDSIDRKRRARRARTMDNIPTATDAMRALAGEQAEGDEGA
jgi:hypothetical protein